jgi:hypothetical protein
VQVKQFADDVRARIRNAGWWFALRAESPATQPIVVSAAVFGLVNLALIGIVLREAPVDWGYYVGAVERLTAGQPLYGSTVPGASSFNYNPLVAYGMAFVVPLGYPAWVILHIAVAALLPRPLGLLALVTFPWWWDVALGNELGLELLFAAWAVRGHGWAIGTTFVVALLVPRPLIVPLVLWLLWQYPAWRVRFVAIVVLVGAATLATGQAGEWLAGMGRTAGDVNHYWNMSPSRFLGFAWLPIGAALAVVLVRRGYVGLACLAVSPYLLPYYLMFALLDIRPRAQAPAALGREWPPYARAA